MTRGFYVVLLAGAQSGGFDPRWLLAIMQRNGGRLPELSHAALRLLDTTPEIYADLPDYGQLGFVLEYIRMWSRKLGVAQWRYAALLATCLRLPPLARPYDIPFSGHLENELRAARETLEYRLMLAEMNSVADDLAWGS